MEDIKKQVVVLSLIESMKNSGSWCGETHIQKSVYFLQTMLNVPTDFDFILYKHGPFSFELRDSLGEMRGNMLVESTSRFPYGPSYRSTASGKALIERYPKTAAAYQKQMEYITRHFAGLGVAELERLATALYVTEKEGHVSVEERAKKINEIKPHIPIDIAEAAIHEVEKIEHEFRLTA
ncbi:MAG TPA: hypothetical protein VN426_04740 [Syntrophomonadaceae bacterium]|nr:hypothetical protein [Syntrophomonadaceae bacterium]